MTPEEHAAFLVSHSTDQLHTAGMLVGDFGGDDDPLVFFGPALDREQARHAYIDLQRDTTLRRLAVHGRRVQQVRRARLAQLERKRDRFLRVVGARARDNRDASACLFVIWVLCRIHAGVLRSGD